MVWWEFCRGGRGGAEGGGGGVIASGERSKEVVRRGS